MERKEGKKKGKEKREEKKGRKKTSGIVWYNAIITAPLVLHVIVSVGGINNINILVVLVI